MSTAAPIAANQADKTGPDPMARLTLVALVIALVLVAVRMTLTESVRQSLDFGNAFADLPAAPGATTTLLLDLLCWTPAVLILVRRAIDPQYVLRTHWSHLLMSLLGAWIWASTFWAGDRFAAVVNASTWSAAMALGWATSQLVRSWTRLRGVLAIALGLLMILIAQSAIYRFYELPETIREFETHKDQFLAANHWMADDPIAQMYEQKLQRGEVIGFFKSPNTLAAVAALAAFITIGFAVQRRLDGDPIGFTALTSAASALGLGVMVMAGSRTAIAGGVLFGILLTAAWLNRDRLKVHATALLWAGYGVVALGGLAVLAIGLKTGGLIQDSLTFRWNYWVASWHLFLAHPVVGVGWSSFGNAYLKYRLPVAAEEIKDPHNVLIHFLTETGTIGIALLIAWIGRTAYEATRPVSPRPGKAEQGTMVPTAIAVTVAFVLLRGVAGGGISLLLPELLKLLLFGVLLLLGLILAGVHGVKDLAADARPAPFLLYAALAGIGGFLLHNLVDFALFENGPLMLFVLVLGAVLGARHAGVAGKRLHTGAAIAGLCGVFLYLLVVAMLVVFPIGTAELKAADAESAAQQNRYGLAVSLYREAMVDSPVPNADYALRAARYSPPEQSADAAALYTQAVSADPTAVTPWLSLARLASQAHDEPAKVFNYYSAVIDRNPNDPTLRIEFGSYLDSIARPDDAVAQYRAAMAIDGQMHADEPRRIPRDQRAAITARLKR